MRKMIVLAVPCRYIIVERSKYHSCALLDGCVCQFLNPSLTDITMTVVIKPSKLSLTGNPDEGSFEAKITDHETELHNIERPEDSYDLDTQCPAGYTWEQVEAKFEAVRKLCPKRMNAKDAERIYTLLRNMHETNIMEAEK